MSTNHPYEYMKKKLTIAIDIDDVLAAENDDMREFINEQYELRLTAEDYNINAVYGSYWEKVWGVSDEEGQSRYQAFLNSGIKGSHQLVPGAAEAIARLKRDYNLVIVTSRNDGFIDITRAWLDQHFANTFASIEFVAVWSTQQIVSKATICKQIKASHLIDDNLEHCTLAAEKGIAGLLFGEYGWNKIDILPENITRVKNWQAVLEYFNVQN